MKFNVGDKVLMSAVGKDEYKERFNNPHNEIGVVRRLDPIDDEYPYRVRWEGGGINSYREVDLEFLHLKDFNEDDWL